MPSPPADSAAAANVPGRNRGSQGAVRQDGNERQNRLDPLAHQERGGGRRFAEAHGKAVDAAEGFSGACDRCLRCAPGIEPRSVNPLNFTVVAGDRGDERGIAAPAAGVRAIRESVMESQGGKTAAADAAGAKIFFGV